MVGFAVELAQVGTDVGAQSAHQLLAKGQHGVGKYRAPIFGDEHQVGVQVVDGAWATAHVGVGMGSQHVAEG